jgi:transposase
MMTRGEHVEIRSLRENGVSWSEISRMVGADRKTVQKYAGLDQYHPFFRERRPAGKLEPYKQYIQSRLEKYPLSAVRIFDEIKAQGYCGQLTILRDYMKNLRKESSYDAVMMFETAPGQQAQVDWGEFGKIEVDGEQQKLYGFHMILGHSRMRYLEFTTSMNLRTLVGCHIGAYHYFGGAPHENLYDNMKTVVLKRRKNAEDSDFHPLFSDFMAYYGTAIKLCRIRKPRTKGKVESLVDYAKDNFFLGTEFADLADLNMKARAWMDKVNSQIHSTTGEAPAERLKKEQPLLIQIGGRPDYRICETLYRKSRCKSTVSVYSSEYSVPPKYANREVEVKIEEEQLGIFYHGQEIARHRLVGRKQTSFLEEHRKQLEEGCFHMPRQNRAKRTPAQVEIAEQGVAVRNLNAYEGV